VPPKLFIISPHRAASEALGYYFSARGEFTIVRLASDEPGTLALITQTAPRLILLDQALSRAEALKILLRWKGQKSRPVFVLLVDEMTSAWAQAVMAAGADHVVAKSASLADLAATLKLGVTTQTVPAGNGGSNRADPRARQGEFAAALTAREKLVLRLVAAGGSNKEIAGQLRLSPFTVENHRAAIRRKLDLRTTQQLVIYAMQNGLLSVPGNFLPRRP
jgi:DNA-binding NarL/FixJ family response regulator